MREIFRRLTDEVGREVKKRRLTDEEILEDFSSWRKGRRGARSGH